jgi:hypothetical protein
MTMMTKQKANTLTGGFVERDQLPARWSLLVLIADSLRGLSYHKGKKKFSELFCFWLHIRPFFYSTLLDASASQLTLSAPQMSD